ncbi:polyglutamine-binding protein 1 [Octopus bimaculoides]|uniref:Polyglutamine-binding protein 1 n=1 Tax=Octopus bimaculoides TaxID=37653 RepID=A0A0L8HZY1_OCTBM|nr:polyglutamine-binding protein 1 [Octopus bimaculoides]|eukprot:XP_014767969.1 PREDICTED: polyglutamine-binding protein 1-like [Octopus bimaculoides]
MPLPAALLAKLSKRGIIKAQEPKKPEDVEEVFAEDYDEPTQPFSMMDTVGAPGTLQEETVTKKDETVESLEEVACPNKSNPYHKCTEYCLKRYGKITFKPDPETERRRLRMLMKHPLPEGWQEIPDKATNRYYYWNVVTDQVSWLSPSHPKAQIVALASKGLDTNKTTPPKSGIDSDGMGNDSDVEEEDLSGSELDEDSSEEEQRQKVERNNRKNSRSRGQSNLDPMDPAAYSNAPRGTWSTGLDKRGEAKTGADVTASGPLYQQRPYPAPGDVLRMNRQLVED